MTPEGQKVEPEDMFIARQRLGKQVSAATDTQPNIEELLGTTFSVRFVPRGYRKCKEDRLSQLSFETPACQDVSLGVEKSKDGIE
jgi:hypothetical protein